MRGETRLSYSMVAINVMDLNDNAPQINVDAAVGFIRENSPPSTLITRLRPTDEDVSDTGTTFAYRIVDAHLGKVSSYITPLEMFLLMHFALENNFDKKCSKNFRIFFNLLRSKVCSF